MTSSFSKREKMRRKPPAHRVIVFPGSDAIALGRDHWHKPQFKRQLTHFFPLVGAVYQQIQRGAGTGPDLDAYELSMLQPLEQSIQHAALEPAVHSHVDRVPVTKALWQTTPLAAMFG